MPNLRDIKKRINSVQSTKQITRTMEMVATAKIRHASSRVQAATPYARSMYETLATLSEDQSLSSNPLLAKHDEVKHIVLIAVTSDRGLAGGFNSYVLRAVDQFVVERQKNGVEVELIACGKKAIAYFNYRGYHMALKYAALSADPTIAQAREIASFVSDMYTSGKTDQVFIYYNHARNSADQDLTFEEVLPVEPSETDVALQESKENAESMTEKLMGDFEFEPSAAEVLDALLPAYVENRIYHALIDSAAGEQGARRKAMKSATDNATDMVNTLTRSYNRARQGAITTELNEIVGGASALEDE